MERLRAIIEKIEAPLTFAAKDSCKNLPLVRDLGKVLGLFAEQLRSEVLAADPRKFALPSCDDLLADFTALFQTFDTLSPEEKIACLAKAVSCWQELKEILSAARTTVHLPAGEAPPADRRSPLPADLTLETSFQKISLPVAVLRGVGPKTSRLLEIKNIKTIEDLLYYLPRGYEDRRSVQSISRAEVGCRETVVGEITQAGIKGYGRKRFFSLSITDGDGNLAATWFRGNLTYLTRTFTRGARVMLTGKIAAYRQAKSMIHPDYEILEGKEEDNLFPCERIVPLYSETEGLTQKMIRRLMIQALNDYASYLPSPLPDEICKKRRLIDMPGAIRAIHVPPGDHEAGPYHALRAQAHRRLVYDECFFFQLGMALTRKGRARDAATVFKTGGDLPARFLDLLPYRLTAAQRRVIREIETDMAGGCTMNRLLQGDVGCGKTVVAFAAMTACCENGCQAAIMVPTEILAIQHYGTIRNWATKLGLEVALLTGSTGHAERKNLSARIARGKTNIVIGTHALIQEGVVFNNLGLAVIDEQHRFGVAQRATLRKKGGNPHVLVMTATPIPRTLAMTFYGDLDVSVIDEFPPGRKPVLTAVVREEGRQKVYGIIDRELQQGHKAFIVYPLVEESQNSDLKNATDMAEHLQREVFPGHRLGLIHGRMPDREKERIMAEFLGDTLDILVSTTVIEVGIEIPGASLMIIEHAERFGLSQLHQLRGRVGRSDIPSQCILMAGGEASGQALKRLRIMEKTSDGFLIAETDLALRGSGEFMGTRQTGLPDFRVTDMVQDIGIVQEAREDAFALAERDPELGKKEHAALKKVLRRRWAERMDLVKTG